MLFFVLVQPRVKRPLKGAWTCVSYSPRYETIGTIAAALHEAKNFSVKITTEDRLKPHEVVQHKASANTAVAYQRRLKATNGIP
jgi:hypothetical protein